ncbi:type VI secretion protein [Mesorhizobium sp. SARCC-RB16n]|uniref:relaxase/mobilization nuclease domain-containing protein n=1 Tax=Mesorhizobium sp. SARCC-RB16n TaxID=2116687 RepID=UPI00122F982F|nr:VirD2 family relaxase/mobilization nuclease [Mesorhizobium sp. SARCC-RB16n]KAA3447984.1 type VI secretion protein [Mesorhizobium sp. SARCC-RB16n]
MSGDDDFRVRPGRIRSRHSQRVRPFIAQALAAAQKAGGRICHDGRITNGRGSSFGRGRVASIRANRFITSRSRSCTVKALVVRHKRQNGPLARHLNYLRREGVTRDGEKARMFGLETDDADVKDFADRCANDRHHFRFIVSPQDAIDMADLKAFTRDLMGQAEKDLGTKLDWLAVDHWNTDNPHIHIILRGRAEDGQDLVISRDYIKNGMRNRAQDLITQELGLRTDREILRTYHQQIEAERWTELDRQLVREVDKYGIVDSAPIGGRKPDEYLAMKVGRLRKLESLGLAHPIGAGQWTLGGEAEATLRALGERNDIIKRMHRTLAEHGLDRGAAEQVLAGEASDAPIIGKLMERGLDDELRASAYAIVDGTDGRTHYIRFQNIDATGDSAPGSIVELRRYEDGNGRSRVALAVRSDLSIEEQVSADGATWLDRQLAHGPTNLGEGGFAQQVKQALEDRTQHLVEKGFARREADRVILARNLIAALRAREVEALGEQLAAGTGLPFTKATEGDQIAGTYRRRFSLASGRFAMIDDGLGFKLVPWSPALDKHLGSHLAGVMRAGGGVDWAFGRKRGLGL